MAITTDSTRGDSVQTGATSAPAHFKRPDTPRFDGQIDHDSEIIPPDTSGSAPRLGWRAVYLASAAALVVLLFAALVPLLAICPYNHSFADDWHYGVDAHLALQAGGSVIDAIGAALQEAYDTFFSWQGTYSAIVLMALQPGVFSEALYGLGAVGVLAALMLATWYFASVLVRDVLDAGRLPLVAFASLILLLQTQLLPSPVEGIYWYNAAIYYTFYHALMLVMAGLSVRLVHGRTRKGPLSGRGSAVRAVALVLLAFVVAGGNFVTGIVSALLLGGACVAAVLKARGRLKFIVPAFVVFVAGFAVSMAAPGNAARQASQFAGDNLGVVLTLANSALSGMEYVVLWSNGYLVCALAVALPFMVLAAKRSTCSFAHPLAVAGLSLALFMASFTPTFYSMGNVGPGRVQNIRYDLFVVIVFICVMWTVGRIVRLTEARAADAGERTAWLCLFSSPRAYAVYVLACLLLIVGSVGALALDSRHADDLTSVSAARSLLSGEAAAYDREVWERYAIIESSDSDEVDVPYYTVGPKVLFMGDIYDNMDNYMNYRLAQWFGKKSILAYHSQL